MLFKTNPDIEFQLCAWLMASPESRYARKACFLYEWLTEQRLPVDDPVSSRARYIPIVDTKYQFALSDGERITRFKVINNLLGPREFCPMVRQTNYLQSMLEKDLQKQTQHVLAQYEQPLLRRAAAYFYLKETQSSFEM
ncbi:MAG: hypothetical protein V4629_01185 [Pseudomonadota bacterium]